MSRAQKNEPAVHRIFMNCDVCIGLTPHFITPSGRLICEYCRSEEDIPGRIPPAAEGKKKRVCRVH